MSNWWAAFGSAPRGFQVLVDDLDVVNSEPDPGAAASLPAAAKVNSRRVAIYAGKVFVAPTGIGESEDTHVEAQARLHVLDSQDRLTAFIAHARWIGLVHKFLPKETESITR